MSSAQQRSRMLKASSLAMLLLLSPSCASNASYIPDKDPVSFTIVSNAPGLNEAVLEQTVAAYQAHPPRTLSEMCTLLGASPLKTGSDSKGDYAMWMGCEYIYHSGRLRHYAAWAACQSRDGVIISSCIKTQNPEDEDGEPITFGDASLFNVVYDKTFGAR